MENALSDTAMLDFQIGEAVKVLRGCSFINDVHVYREPGDYVSITVTTNTLDVCDDDAAVILRMFPDDVGARQWSRHEYSLAISYSYEGLS